MQSLARGSVVASTTCLIATCLVGRTLAAQSRVPGWRYTTNITIDSGGAGRGSMAMQYQVTARYLRMDFVQVSGTSAPAGPVSVEGMYQVIDDADSTLTMVMPRERTAMISQPSALLAGQGLGALSVRSHTTSSRVEDLGEGGRILGHRTHHYRVATTGTLEMRMRGQVCTQDLDMDDEMWVAADVDLGPAMKAMAGHFMSLAGITQLSVDTAGGSGMPPGIKGTALRQITRTTGRSAAGSMRPVTVTMEVVDLSSAPIDVSVFAVPADYRTMDMRTMTGRLPAGMVDSVVRATAATSSHCQ